MVTIAMAERYINTRQATAGHTGPQRGKRALGGQNWALAARIGTHEAKPSQRNKNGALPAGSRTAVRPEVGIEPTTTALQKRSSAIELPWRPT